MIKDHGHHAHELGDAGNPTMNRQGTPRTKQASTPPTKGKVNTNSTDNSNQTVDESLSLVDPSGASDMSLQFFHPIVRDETHNLSGMFRSSLPTTEKSQSLNAFNYGYNVVYSQRMAKQWSFASVFSIGYWSKTTYTTPLDNLYGFGLINSINKRLNPWVKLGVGQRSNLTEHTERPEGKTVELFTTADFLITPTIFMGPRIHFPLYSEGPTFTDVPTDPSIRNISADFYFQIAL